MISGRCEAGWPVDAVKQRNPCQCALEMKTGLIFCQCQAGWPLDAMKQRNLCQCSLKMY